MEIFCELKVTSLNVTFPKAQPCQPGLQGHTPLAYTRTYCTASARWAQVTVFKKTNPSCLHPTWDTLVNSGTLPLSVFPPANDLKLFQKRSVNTPLMLYWTSNPYLYFSYCPLYRVRWQAGFSFYVFLFASNLFKYIKKKKKKKKVWKGPRTPEQKHAGRALGDLKVSHVWLMTTRHYLPGESLPRSMVNNVTFWQFFSLRRQREGTLLWVTWTGLPKVKTCSRNNFYTISPSFPCLYRRR